MDTGIDNLKKLLEQLQSIGFFSRLFRWGGIRRLLINAASDMQKLAALKTENSRLEMLNSNNSKDLEILKENLIKKESEIERLNRAIKDSDAKISVFTADLSAEKTTAKNLQGINNQLSTELSAIKQKLLDIEQNLKEAREQNTHLFKEAEFRKQEHSNEMAVLKQFQEQIKEGIEERNNAEIERIRKLKETWSNHQEKVKGAVKSICEKHTILYVDKVPFKGEPDNTLKICDEYIIFDAKSPANDDLTNFPNYLKDQAERAKKYARQEDVKTDIFFVVPSNTLEILEGFVFRLADYNVFIISLDSLEPVILSLKKIEDYEFAEQLSPEDRENICRVLGKFAHLSKRRIQIDSYFAKQFFELNYKCESDLPRDILDKAVEFEKSEKLNPPIERRTKQINVKELEKDAVKLKNEAGITGILIQEDKISTELNKLPLYQDKDEK